uniref:Chemokine interleukin-8-like domain-containing protein n=1 Tax=Ursus americanus TaxID=9643 RepID=A0A452QBK6_URSAM
AAGHERGRGFRCPQPLAGPRAAAPGAAAPAEEDLRCVCVKTTPLVRPKDVSSLEVIVLPLASWCPPTLGLLCLPFCASAPPFIPPLRTPFTPRLIPPSLNNGRKICLDPNAVLYKKIIRKLLKS